MKTFFYSTWTLTVAGIAVALAAENYSAAFWAGASLTWSVSCYLLDLEHKELLTLVREHLP